MNEPFNAQPHFESFKQLRAQIEEEQRHFMQKWSELSKSLDLPAPKPEEDQDDYRTQVYTSMFWPSTLMVQLASLRIKAP